MYTLMKAKLTIAGTKYEFSIVFSKYLEQL